MSIQETKVSGEDIHKIILDLEPYIFSIPRIHGIIACLQIAAVLQAPAAAYEDIAECVYETSRFMCLHLDGKQGVDGEEVKRLLN